MMKYAIAAFGIATAGGTLGYQTLAPTAAKADKMVDDRLAAPIAADANDFIYQWGASHDYNPSAGLEQDRGDAASINSADDERNPPETGVTDAALKRIKNGKLYLIPASDRDARPSHHRQREILQAAIAGIAGRPRRSGRCERVRNRRSARNFQRRKPVTDLAASDLPAIYPKPSPRVIAKARPEIDAHARKFIAMSPFCVLATSAPTAASTPRRAAAIPALSASPGQTGC